MNLEGLKAELDGEFPDPIHQHGDKWWFLDETRADHGPYDSEQEAQKALNVYASWLLDQIYPQ